MTMTMTTLTTFHSTTFSVLFVVSFVVIRSVNGYNNGLGLTPPMGWNSWNKFACDIHEDLIIETAQAIVDLGLNKLGYRYINLDDCWQLSRNSSGYIQEDFNKFPSGIRYLSDTIHTMVDNENDDEHDSSSSSLLFGLYSSAGIYTCQRRPGSLNYEIQDSISYIVEYNIDYLKYDNCYSMGILPQIRYKKMHDALNSTGSTYSKAIFYSMCEWGNLNVATWAQSIGNSWRTTGDINPTFTSIMTIADKNNKWHTYGGIGGWNDPDMLEIGNGRLTEGEEKIHFTLWCVMKSPLLLGMDVTSLDTNSTSFKIITNKELIDINQDVLGIQGYKRTSIQNSNIDDVVDDAPDELERDDNSLEVWAGPLVNDNIVVVLLNRSTQPSNITAYWSDIGIVYNNTNMNVRDLWNHEELGIYSSLITAYVESHDVVALRLSPIEGKTSSSTSTSVTMTTTKQQLRK